MEQPIRRIVTTNDLDVDALRALEDALGTLIVKDVKSGANRTGEVALWIGPGTVAHFRNLTVKPDPQKR
jgi:hypothetical protein